MAEVSTGQAALQLGCSVDTVRRKVRRGELQGRTDARGRLWILLPDAVPVAEQNAGETVPLRVLLTEVQLQRDALLVQLEQAAVERAELRRLLGNAQQQLGIVQEQLGGLLAAPHAEQDPEPPAQHVATAPTIDATPAEDAASTTTTVRRSRWAFWRR